jgi:peptide/nickel transport system substrate-binding protein
LHTQDPTSFNASYYSNKDFDALIDEAYVVSATDRDKAAQLYAEAVALQAEDAPLAWIYVETNQPVINTTIVGNWGGYSPAYPWEVAAYEVEPVQ